MTKKKKKVEKQIADVENVLSALHKFLDTMGNQLRSAHIDGTATPHRKLLAARLSRMTLEEALIHWASRNEGILNSYTVRPVLVEAGLLKGSPGAVSSRLYEALSNSEHFEQMEGGRKGRWRLVTTNREDDDDSPI
ncbi:MAG: hypothetical protein OXD31_16845 [Chloroflexi bacterium]|nr:hypothetical protein [Chloroflexota bacterium]